MGLSIFPPWVAAPLSPLCHFYYECNGLGNHIVSAETIESFKRRLNKFMNEDDGWD